MKCNDFVYLVKQKTMATEVNDKDYVTVKVTKEIGTKGIKRVKDFIKFLEVNERRLKGF